MEAIKRLFRRTPKPKLDPHKIIGVTLGWDLEPHICFETKTYLPTKAERLLYPEYFVYGDGIWPTDPITKEKLPIAKMD